MKSVLTMLAAAAAFGLTAPAVAHEEGSYGASGPNYYFYGPSTNYFGAAMPSYAPPSYGPAAAYYGGHYGDDDWNNPPQYYDAIRQDPWHGYNDDWDNGY